MKNRIMLTYLISLMHLLILCSCNQKPEPETYLIPSDFIGKVNILFNQNGTPVKYKNVNGQEVIHTPQIGEPVKYENGRRVYEIPASGILLTQFKDEYGFVDRKYYSVDATGKRTELEVFKFEHFKKDSAGYVVKNNIQKGVFGDGTSVSYGNMNLKAQDFYVSAYNQLDSFFTKEYLKNFNEKVERITRLKL
ncbi:MAG: hypothetical protein J0M10_11155 [Chitinophagales bacterium]|nr:hypothetical protein [Chitinophagales bacterium]